MFFLSSLFFFYILLFLFLYICILHILLSNSSIYVLLLLFVCFYFLYTYLNSYTYYIYSYHFYILYILLLSLYYILLSHFPGICNNHNIHHIHTLLDKILLFSFLLGLCMVVQVVFYHLLICRCFISCIHYYFS